MTQDKLARIISAVFSPYIVITVFGIFGILSVRHTIGQLLIRILLFLICVIGIPLLYIIAGIRRGAISDLHVSLREQRAGPFVAATVGGAGLLLAYRLIGVPRVLYDLAAAVIVCGVIFGLITARWKISIHAASYAGGILILTLVRKQPWWLLLELFLPVIIWARWRRRHHDPLQGLAGAGLVSLCVYLVFQLVN